MGSDFDKWQDDQHVALTIAECYRFNPRTVNAILRNAERPSEWPENRLPAHTSTRNGLTEAAREFVKVNPTYTFPDADKPEGRKY